MISVFGREKTFDYDPGLGRHVMDPDRQGAPPAGVRFILYAPVEGRPDAAQEVGYADLIDEGDGIPKGVAVRLVVVEADRTVLDYRTAVDLLARGGRVTAEGFIQGPMDRLGTLRPIRLFFRPSHPAPQGREAVSSSAPAILHLRAEKPSVSIRREGLLLTLTAGVDI